MLVNLTGQAHWSSSLVWPWSSPGHLVYSVNTTHVVKHQALFIVLLRHLDKCEIGGVSCLVSGVISLCGIPDVHVVESWQPAVGIRK